MIRLFVAIELPDAVRARLARMCAGVPGARWAAPENMHLTLRFIGEVEEPLVEELVDSLAHVRAPVFELFVETLGAFDAGGPPHTLWAGVRPDERLHRLQAKIERATVGCGLKPEGRRYTPHVTLARLKGTTTEAVVQFLAANQPLREGPFPISEFAMFSSFLGRSGAIHQVEAVFALDGGDGDPAWPVAGR